MPKFTIEIKTKSFAMESKDFATSEEAKEWFRDNFKIAVGEYRAELIEYSGFNVKHREYLRTEPVA